MGTTKELEEAIEIAIHDEFREPLGWLGCLTVHNYYSHLHIVHWLTHRSLERRSPRQQFGATSSNLSEAHIFREKSLAEKCVNNVMQTHVQVLSIGLRFIRSVMPAYSYTGESSVQRVLSPYSDCRSVDIHALVTEWTLDEL